MSTSFGEALLPLRRAMADRVFERQVLRVEAEAEGSDFRPALGPILDWAEAELGAALPAEAREGRAFEAARGESLLRADAAESEDAVLWGLRAEWPDPRVPGRRWITEATLREPLEGPLRVVLRRAVRTSLADHDGVPLPEAPGCLAALALRAGLRADGVPLCAVREVRDREEAEALLGLMLHPGRRLPVLAISVAPWVEGPPRPLLPPESLGARVLGLCHVVLLSEPASWLLTERLGKVLSVYQGAIRLYGPGFGPTGDPYAHRLILPHRLRDEAGREVVLRDILLSLAAASLDRRGWGFDAPTPSEIRGLAASLRLAGAEDGSPDGQEAMRARIEALEAARAERQAEEAYMAEELERERGRAEAAEAQLRGAEARIAALEARLRGGAPEETAEPDPATWPELIAWADRALAGRLVLAPSARRSAKKPDYAEVPQVAASLRWLAETARASLSGEVHAPLSDAPILDGIRNTHCGGDAFRFDHRGRSLMAEWHVKSGGNTRDPARCLRIYWAFDPDSGQVVVAHFPSHRDSAAS